MVWYSHLLQNFPQFVVIHTIKGFGIVNKAEIDVFLELSRFFDDLTDSSSLYILETSPSPHILSHYFLPICGLSFHFLNCVFQGVKVLNFKLGLPVFSFMICAFVFYLINFCLSQGHRALLLSFLPEVFAFR